MSLVFFQGLNCYVSSLLNVAHFMGADYRCALANLWSETDFTYDQLHQLYLSRRLPYNLENLGVKEVFLNCLSPSEVEKGLTTLSHGQWMVVGMDAYDIPWTPYYKTLHSSHYFVARQEVGDGFTCYDPTYNIEHMELVRGDMIAHADDICVLSSIPLKHTPWSIRQESEEILRSHSRTLTILLNQIEECAYGKQNNAGLLAQYAEALLNNRYLYLHYLQSVPTLEKICTDCFTKEFFQKWTAVKHGLYKAYVRQNNQGLVQEVCGLLTELVDKEISIATKLERAV